MVNTVTRQTQLVYGTKPQQSRIRRTMWRVTGNASFRLQRRMFVGEGPLLIGVTLDTGRIGAGC